MLSSRRAEAHLKLAGVYMDRSSFPNARKTTKQVFEFAPDHPGAQAMLAQVAAEEEDAALYKWGERRDRYRIAPRRTAPRRIRRR